MDFHPGRCKTLDAHGQVTADGPCRAALADDGLVVEAEGLGDPTYLYYSDIDRLAAQDYELRLTMANGEVRVLYFLGSYFGQLARDLSARRREQLLKNLLLAGDGASAQDFGGTYSLDAGPAGAARLLLYPDSLVVFPEEADPFAFNYADLTGLDFDPSAYALTLSFDLGERLALTRLGNRFREFQQAITRQRDALFQRSAAFLGAALPPGTAEGTLIRLARVMPLGRAASRAEIEAVGPGLWDRLVTAAVPGGGDGSEPDHGGDPDHGDGLDDGGGPAADAVRQALQWLAARSAFTYLGIREPGRRAAAQADGEPDAADGRSESEPESDGEAGSDTGGETAAVPLFWFVAAFPERNVLASEVLGESGHATYFFRLGDQASAGPAEAHGVDRAARRLARALRALNFRREVIMASDADLAGDRMLRYRVALRKLPYLSDVRRAFLGRAIHRTGGGWEKQAQRLLGP